MGGVMSRTASLFASLFETGPLRLTTEATPDRARPATGSKADSLRYLPPPGLAGWPALPERDRRLLEWMVLAEYVTADLAALLTYGSLRIAQRRLARLRGYRLVTGFWSANAQRPRGRYAYRLTSTCRQELEALMWGDNPLPHYGRGDGRSVIHHLAVHDLLAALLRAGTSEAGLVAWLPERVAAALFGGYLRPDAIAALRVADQLVLLFVERDTGTERAGVIAAKLRRYGALVGSRAEVRPAHVVVVTDTRRRASTLQAGLAGNQNPAALPLWLASAAELEDDPWSATLWAPMGEEIGLAALAGHRLAADLTVLSSGCLLDPLQAAAIDEQALERLPMLHHFQRRAGL